jgi:hypothetical protein
VSENKAVAPVALEEPVPVSGNSPETLRNPRSPGLKRVLSGAVEVRQPSVPSLLGTTTSVIVFLALLGGFVALLDDRLQRVLFAAGNRSSVLAGLAVVLLGSAAFTALTLPLSLTGEARHMDGRQRLRYVFAALLLVLGLSVALLAARGAAA